MRTATLFVLMLAGTASGAEQGTAPAEIIQQLRARWIASSEYTLAVAEKMPADKYAFRPTAEQMTLRPPRNGPSHSPRQKRWQS
jgi:hypothetical protein